MHGESSDFLRSPPEEFSLVGTFDDDASFAGFSSTSGLKVRSCTEKWRRHREPKARNANDEFSVISDIKRALLAARCELEKVKHRRR